ncbi:MAG: flavodoxin domain-containing protein [Terracidiphilus sp.]
MAAPVLIAYATRSGSTGEVAEAIGSRMREAGLQVEVARMRDLKAIGDRTAVVLGAPLYMGGLPGELHRFLAHNRIALTATKTWFFVLGPIEGKPEEFEVARGQTERRLAKGPWFKPSALEVFGGKFDVNRMPFPFSLARYLPAFPAKDLPPKDIRDWDAIRAWAEGIARQLLPAA